MSSNLLNYRIILAALIVSIAVGAAACSSPDGGTTMNKSASNSSATVATTPVPTASKSATSDAMMKSSPGALSAPYDLQFIDTMSAHHESAIKMAQMAAMKAEHPELKTFAAKMIEDQKKEIVQLKKWREEWYAGKPQAVNMEMPGMMDSMKGMDMAKMESATGPAFDLMFIEMMIPHHSGAVAMAKDALTKAEHADIKQVSQSLISKQQEEIKKISEWRAAWSS